MSAKKYGIDYRIRPHSTVEGAVEEKVQRETLKSEKSDQLSWALAQMEKSELAEESGSKAHAAAKGDMQREMSILTWEDYHLCIGTTSVSSQPNISLWDWFALGQ